MPNSSQFRQQLTMKSISCNEWNWNTLNSQYQLTSNLNIDIENLDNKSSYKLYKNQSYYKFDSQKDKVRRHQSNSIDNNHPGMRNILRNLCKQRRAVHILDIFYCCLLDNILFNTIDRDCLKGIQYNYLWQSYKKYIHRWIDNILKYILHIDMENQQLRTICSLAQEEYS